MEIAQAIYRKLGLHRGNKRLWLQGLRLGTCGFPKGQRFTCVYDLGTRAIRLVADPKGARTVSGRRQPDGRVIPIIDICNAELSAFYPGVARVRAVFAPGVITVTLHHEEAARMAREERLQTHLQRGGLTEGSLCAGIGVAADALHEGLKEGGIGCTLEWMVDRDGRYLQVALDNNPSVTDQTALFEASVEELEPELLEPVDILQVSLPCTGHSRSGRAKNALRHAEEHPTDATSVFGLLALVRHINPGVIVSENVPLARTSPTYALIRAELERRGYAIHELELDAADAGTLEQRRRYWLVAVSRGLGPFDPARLPRYAPQHRCLGEALEAVPGDDPRWRACAYLFAKADRDRSLGKNFQMQVVDATSPSLGTIGRDYNKVRSTEPLLAHPNHPGHYRLLTPVEHCRVKGIPEVFVRSVPRSIAHQGLGQSILYGHARAIGHALAHTLRHALARVRPRPAPLPLACG